MGVGFCVRHAGDGARAIRVLAVVDAFTRENLSLEVDTSLSSRRVTRTLEAVIAQRVSFLGERYRRLIAYH
jgi:transposase InsO family protein